MSEHMTEAEALRLTCDLLDRHGVKGWMVKFGSARAQAGVTDYHKRLIRYSRPLFALFDYAEAEDTVKHEVAHVLAGHAAAHGPGWKNVFLALGGSGRTSWKPTEGMDVTVLYRWAYTCRSCKAVLGQTINRRNYSRSVTRCCQAKVATHPINRPVSRIEAAS